MNATDPPHWTLTHVLVCFVLFGCIWTVWLPYKTQCKMGRTGAKVRATESRLKFSHQTHPIVLVGSQTHILVRFVLFGYIWYRLVALQNSVQNGPKWCKSSCHEVVSEFFATNIPIHPIEPKTHVSLCFVLFWCNWYRLVSLQNSVQNGLKWCKTSCHEVVSEFFTTNHS